MSNSTPEPPLAALLNADGSRKSLREVVLDLRSDISRISCWGLYKELYSRLDAFISIAKTSEDLDLLLFDPDRGFSWDVLGDAPGYTEHSSYLAHHTKAQLWSPAALRAACECSLYTCIEMLNKPGLSSEQYMVMAEAIAARFPSRRHVHLWRALEEGIERGHLDLGLPGVQALLKCWIGCKDGPTPSREVGNSLLDANIRRMSDEVLASLPLLPDWNDSWSLYVGLAITSKPLPVNFWRAAYPGNGREPRSPLMGACPGVACHPYLAWEWRLSKFVSHPKEPIKRVLALKEQLALQTRIRASGTNRASVLWNRWHVATLSELPASFPNDMYSGPYALLTEGKYAVAIGMWPQEHPLPRALLRLAEVPTLVRDACVERWHVGGASRDWATMCGMPPDETTRMAALCLQSLSPEVRSVRFSEIPSSHRQTWSLLWSTDPRTHELADEMASAKEREQREAEHAAAEKVRMKKARAAATRVALTRKRRAEGTMPPRPPRVGHVPAVRIDWPSPEEILERLKSTPMSKLAKEYDVSDSGLRKRLVAAGVDMATLPRVRPRVKHI